MARTTPVSWHVSDLLARIQATPRQDPYCVVCPNFQRGPQWGHAKKQAFIKSARSGWPVGTLLVHDEPINVGNNVHHVYQLVDGLQRTVTLREYEEAPFKYLTADQYSRIHYATLASLLAAEFPNEPVAAQALEAAFVEWLKRKGGTGLAVGYTQNDLFDYLCESLHLPGSSQQGFNSPQWGQLLTDVAAEASLASYPMPVLEYDGPAADLHTIFECVNKGGLPLTKYQVVGSSWNTRLCTIANADIRNRIHQRYAQIQQKSGIKVPNVPPQNSAQGYPLFDYMFGLGRWLESKYPLLFGDAGEPEEVHGIAFTLTCIAHGLPLSRLEALPSRLFMNQNTREIDLSAFEAALERACDFVDRSLRDMLFQVLDHAGMNRRMHTDYMIFAMVCSVLVSEFDNSDSALGHSWVKRSSWTTQVESAFRRALRRRYVLEIVKLKEWSGTGDKQLFERVWDKEAGGYPDHPSAHYAASPAQKELADQLDVWWQERRQQKEKNRAARTDKAEALILRLTCMRRLNVHVVAIDQLELEHLLPVQRVQTLIRRSASLGLPFNAVPNLVLLDAELNRRKRARTLAEFYDQVATRWSALSDDEKRLKMQATGPERWDVPDNITEHATMMMPLSAPIDPVRHFVITKDAAGHDSWTPQDFMQMVDDYWLHQRREVLAVLW